MPCTNTWRPTASEIWRHRTLRWSHDLDERAWHCILAHGGSIGLQIPWTGLLLYFVDVVMSVKNGLSTSAVSTMLSANRNCTTTPRVSRQAMVTHLLCHSGLDEFNIPHSPSPIPLTACQAR